MVPVLLEIGPVTLHSFGAMMALAFLIAGYVVSLDLVRKRMDPEHAWSIVVWGAVGGIAGARLLAVSYDWRGFLEEPLSFLLAGSGFVWYGGLIGGFISVTAYLRRAGLPWLSSADAIAPALAIGQAIGRIGCQVSGDGDWGAPTTLPWGMSYPNAVIGWSAWVQSQGLPPDVRVHPAPVYESLAYTAVFLLLWRLRERELRDGSILWLYLVLTSVARFLIEAIRVEPVIALGLTQAQWIAVGLTVIGSIAMLRGGTGRHRISSAVVRTREERKER